MEKIQLEHLDIPIIRSCNLACKGCMTHSDHKNIKGLVRLDESIEWLEFWAKRLKPKAVTLFGGEPLLHPEFTEWATTVSSLWGPDVGISLNTNGYYLDRLVDNVDKLFNLDVGMSLVVSKQTGTEPYLSKVNENVERLKTSIQEYHLQQPGVKSAIWDLWLDEYEVNTKRWYRLVVNGVSTKIGFTTCEQYRLHWCVHYRGHGEFMEPVYNYSEEHYTENHRLCQTKEFVTLYRGRLWKCPPMGVLEHSLNTFNIADSEVWSPYIKDYTTVGTGSTDAEITAWVEQQKNPERVCNMCGFSGPGMENVVRDDRSHMLKNYWNYTL